MKRVLKSILPEFVIRNARRILLRLRQNRNKKRSNRQIFTEIYENNIWGGEPGTFCSGSGSLSEQTYKYVEFIKHFIADKGIRSIVDLGCGDFRVAKNILDEHCFYVGIDIVEDLIQYNRKAFGNDKISFKCLDITSDDLPHADLCLIRQVFQHLSNQSIARVLPKLQRYHYVIITEHFPAPSVNFIINKDKVAGADIRVYDNSAVSLDQPPFNLDHVRLVLETEVIQPLLEQGETLKTFLLEFPDIPSPSKFKSDA